MVGISVDGDPQRRAHPDRGHRGARRRIVTVAGALATVVAGVVGVGTLALPARAATANRAAIVVEVDGVLHTAKVSFAAASISGLDALRSAGFDPSVRVFGGNGGAVCALAVGGATIGCPANGTCLNCAAPDYWSYWRAPAGATRYTYSVIGAGNTQVHDGDVEAWAWGTGAAPAPFVSFAEVWGPDPTTTRPTSTRPPTTPPPTTRRPSPSTVPTTVGGLGTATTVASAGSQTRSAGAAPTVPSPTTISLGASSTTSPVTTGVRAAAAPGGGSRRLATAPVVAHGGGGSATGLVGFAVILLALVGAIVAARRRRSARPSPPT